MFECTNRLLMLFSFLTVHLKKSFIALFAYFYFVSPHLLLLVEIL